MKKSWLLAAYWVVRPGLFGVLASIAVGAWGRGERPLALWCGAWAIICLVEMGMDVKKRRWRV